MKTKYQPELTLSKLSRHLKKKINENKKEINRLQSPELLSLLVTINGKLFFLVLIFYYAAVLVTPFFFA